MEDKLKRDALKCNTEEVREDYRNLRPKEQSLKSLKEENHTLKEGSVKDSPASGVSASDISTSSISSTSAVTTSAVGISTISTSGVTTSGVFVSDTGKEFTKRELTTQVEHRYQKKQMPYANKFCLNWEEVGRKGMWTVTKGIEESTKEFAQRDTVDRRTEGGGTVEGMEGFFARRNNRVMSVWRKNLGMRVSLDARLAAVRGTAAEEQSIYV